MNRAEFRDYHDEKRCGCGPVVSLSLIANATTSALKARLLEEVRKHDRLATGELAELADLAPPSE
jgi:hypothetical protein